MNVGAALVDFVSKAFAEAARNAPFCIGKDGECVQWKLLGSVCCSPTLFASGTAQTVIASSPLAAGCIEAVPFARNMGRQMYVRYRCRHIANASLKKVKYMGNQRKLSQPEIQYTRSTVFSQGAPVEITTHSSINNNSNRQKRRANCFFSDSEVFLTTSSLSTESLSSKEVFFQFEFAFRRLCLGCVHSITRLAADEVIITTDADTSAALREKGRFSCYASSLQGCSSPSNEIEWVVHPVVKRPVESIFFNTRSFSLATKEETIVAVAQLHLPHRNAKSPFKDKYGNLFLPCNSSRTDVPQN